MLKRLTPIFAWRFTVVHHIRPLIIVNLQPGRRVAIVALNASEQHLGGLILANRSVVTFDVSFPL